MVCVCEYRLLYLSGAARASAEGYGAFIAAYDVPAGGGGEEGEGQGRENGGGGGGGGWGGDKIKRGKPPMKVRPFIHSHTRALDRGSEAQLRFKYMFFFFRTGYFFVWAFL